MDLRVYYVYIITNDNRTVLYVGVTNDLIQRMQEHWRNRGKRKSFASRYSCYNLIYYEEFHFILDAIKREKEIKAWRREKKILLIEKTNPQWRFLNEDLLGRRSP